MKEEDISRILEQEEESIRKQCDDIIRVKPDLVFTEKGVSDLAQHFLLKAGITAIRRLKKTDNNRLARVCGARIVNDTTDLRESDVGTEADLFEITKIADEYYTYVTSPTTTACTICLRGPSKDVINEVERNLQDSLHVVRNIMLNPRLVPGGGALEMALAQAITEKGKSMEGVRQWPYKAIARALERHSRSFHELLFKTVVETRFASLLLYAQNTLRVLTIGPGVLMELQENWLTCGSWISGIL
ncbi:hypothetical protein OESDEN_07730 [Oesophagostomum dentatum]|uniref:TCP-1/Cpn60 chaperonin family protein n=1 Tax=Oesophagostomum dentatum TaxID=61180 RepID=A0A0B1T466_OESDE|nr:hypothetical protein OESDEN_07730 [Oesophagostomum dentatum]